jgi:CheY-like chemotaxis protein
MGSQNGMSAILIVDDSCDDARWLQRLLDQAGVLNPVRIVGSSEEARAYVEGGFPFSDRSKYPSPVIIFLDLRMPGADGFEFLERVRIRPDFKNMLVVTISGFDDLGSIRRAYGLGANSFLTKPCRLSDVENLIHGFPIHWERLVPQTAFPAELHAQTASNEADVRQVESDVAER